MGIMSFAMMVRPAIFLTPAMNLVAAKVGHAVLIRLIIMLCLQESNDLTVDFRFFDTQDGSVMLESVTSANSHVVVNNCNRLSITSVVSVDTVDVTDTNTEPIYSILTVVCNAFTPQIKGIPEDIICILLHRNTNKCTPVY